MDKNNFLKTFCLLLFLLTFSTQNNPLYAVELIVRNSLDIPRVNEPVSVGLPFPAGWIKDQSALSLLDADNNLITVQVRPEATWSDGSIMWALLDFTANVAAGDSTVYSLERGKVQESSSQLKVSRDGDKVVVVTGPLKISLAEKSGPLVEGIWLDWNADLLFEDREKVAVSSTDGLLCGTNADNGEPFSEIPGSREKIEIAEQGPQKVQLLVSGKLAGASGAEALDYIMRLYLYAGSAKIRIQLSVRNARTAEQVDDRWLLGCGGSYYLDNLGLKLQFLSGQEPPQMILGSIFDGVGFEARQIPLEKSLSIQQESSGGENWFHRNHVNKNNLIPLAYKGYRVFYGERAIASGNRPRPWISVEDSRKGMAAAVQGFWENFPKQLKVDEQGMLTISLWPRREGGPHEIQGGEQKTHDIYLYFQTGEGPGDKFDHWSTVAMKSCQQPLVAWAPADWYLESGAFGPGVAYSPEKSGEYERLAHAPVMAERYNIFKGREFIDEYGWRNYGDFFADNEPDETHGPNHGKLSLSHWNMAFDYSWGMLLQGVRTANLAPDITDRWWQVASEGARHLTDIDIYHAELDEEGRYALGGRFYHTHHGINAGRATHRASAEEALWDDLHWPWGRGVNNIDSFFYDSRGISCYAMMSGDMNVRRTAIEIADLVVYSIENERNPQIDNFTRQAGNNLQVLTDAWIMTRDDRYRRAADRIVERSRPALFGLGVDDNPVQAEMDGLGFHSIYFDALGRYVEVSDKVFGIRQEMAIESLVNYSLFVLKNMWSVDDGIFAMSVAKGLKLKGNTGVWTYRVCDTLLYAYPYLKDSADRKMMLERTATAFNTANRINLRGFEGYLFDANKNSNFIIYGGPRCLWYMENGRDGSGVKK